MQNKFHEQGTDTMPTITLTKNERHFLTQAARHPHGSVSACRREAKEGTRGTRALVSLRDKGLVDNLRSSTTRDVSRGRITRYTVVSVTITDAGRAALAAHAEAVR